jgi:6-phosphogluconolactonase (cycloisomerase 2 family)
MANDKNFKIKNGLSVGTRYLQTGGTETAGSVGYALSNAEYDSKSFSVASQIAKAHDLFFKSDGTKLYALDNENTNTVYQYSLSTAWDISTASYDSVNLSVSDTGLTSISFKTDGTKLYAAGYQNDTIYEYNLSTAWDLSSATLSGGTFSVNAQATFPASLRFKTDGTKFYIGAGGSNGNVYQYSLSTAWDISTASYESKSLTVSGQDGNAAGIFFKPDGTKMYLVGFTNDAVYQYTLATPWDLSTGSYDSVSFSVASQATAPRALFFKEDGSKLYVIDSTSNSVFQYSPIALTQTLDLSTGNYFSFTPSGATTVSFTNAPASGLAVGFSVEINGDGSAITWPASVKWHEATAPVATATKELYTFVTTDGGTTYYGKKAAEGLSS